VNTSPPCAGYTQTRKLNGAYSLSELSQQLGTNTRKTIEREILLYLSENKTGYLYGIAKHLKKEKHLSVSLSQVGRALDESASEGSIRPLKGPKLKGHKKGPFYYLTLVGLLKLLNYGPSPQDTHLIIEKNKNKVPLLFKEWDYFEANKVAPDIVYAMRYFYFSYILEGKFAIPNYSRSKKKLSKEKKKKERSKKKKLPQPQNWLIPRPKLSSAALTRYILFQRLPMLTLSGFETEYSLQRSEKENSLQRRIVEQCKRISFEWVRIWSENPRLRKYLMEQLVRKEKMTGDVLRRIREVEDHIKQSD